MKFVVYGSLGIAEHIISALSKNSDYSIVGVVDADDRVGALVSGIRVRSIDKLKTLSFDNIIIATMDYRTTVKTVYRLGYTYDNIYQNVSWDPFFLQLEPTARCAFSCVHCIREKLSDIRKGMDLTIEKFIVILKQFPFLKRLHLQGLGEPLMNKDLVLMLKYARSLGVYTSLTTNADLIDSCMGIEICENLDKLVISLDAASGKRFKRLRGKGNWNKIRLNIKKIAADRLPGLSLVINCVLSSPDISHIDEILEFGLDILPSELHFHLAENWLVSGQKGFEREHKKAINRYDYDAEIFQYIERRKKKIIDKGIKKITYTGGSKRKGYCWWPFYGMFISVDGYVMPCCMRMLPDPLNFGNINDYPVKEIWYGASYKKFRSSVYSSAFSTVCDLCPQ